MDLASVLSLHNDRRDYEDEWSRVLAAIEVSELETFQKNCKVLLCGLGGLGIEIGEKWENSFSSNKWFKFKFL